MTLQTKLGITALTLGSGGVATYAALGPRIRGTEISKLIEEEFRYVLLDTQNGTENKDDAEWAKKWQSYYEANKKNKEDIFNLDSWTKEENKQLKDKLKEKCKELAKKEVQNREDTVYKEVTKYCVRDVTIKDHAEREGLQLIKTHATDTANWDKVAKNHAKLKLNFEILKITPETNKDYKGTKVKERCEAVTKQHKGEDNYQTIYESYKKVCVTEAAKEES